MSIEPSNPTTTPDEGWDYKPKNRLGEHTQNVDININRRRRASGYTTTITAYAIIDDPTHGAPYEDTGRELLHIHSRELEGDWQGEHEQSWFDIQSNGWSDKDDLLSHQPLIFQQMVKAAAEAGLTMVRSVES